MGTLSTLEFGLVMLVILMLFIQLIQALGAGAAKADERVKAIIDEFRGNAEAVQLIARAYADASNLQRQVVNVLADLVKFGAPLTSIGSDDSIDDLFDVIRQDPPVNDDAPETPEEPDKPTEPETPVDEGYPAGYTLNENPLLQRHLDGTVDRGSEGTRYQVRPENWLTWWKAHEDHPEAPYINSTEAGPRAELSYIAGRVGYISERFSTLRVGHYMVKFVVDAGITEPPPNRSDVNLGAALLLDGGRLIELPLQQFSVWQGKSTYLVGIRVEAEKIAKLVVYVDMRYPSLGSESSVTFTEARLITAGEGKPDFISV